MSSDTRKPHIQVIGSLNIDLVTVTPRVPAGGETLTATSFATHPGGKGANQAVACARASRRKTADDGKVSDGTQQETVQVSMVGAVGRDTYADLLVSTLKQNGVGSDTVTSVDKTTGVAVILVEEQSGQNRILITPGANAKMQPDILPSFPSPKPDLIVLQLEIPVPTVLHILREAKRGGIDVLLNPAPAVKLPDEAFDGLAHLVLNETEAAIMCDLSPPDESGNLESFLNQAFESLHRRGVRHTIITLGGNGVAFVGTANGKSSWKRIDAHKVPRVVDTTAAGDTFVGYYAVGVVKAKQDGAIASWTPESVVAYANRAAAQTVTQSGAMESIPFIDEI